MFRNFSVKMVPLKNDINYIPKRRKFIIKENYKNATNFIIHDHHLVKGSRNITLDTLTSTEIC